MYIYNTYLEFIVWRRSIEVFIFIRRSPSAKVALWYERITPGIKSVSDKVSNKLRHWIYPSTYIKGIIKWEKNGGSFCECLERNPCLFHSTFPNSLIYRAIYDDPFTKLRSRRFYRLEEIFEAVKMTDLELANFFSRGVDKLSGRVSKITREYRTRVYIERACRNSETIVSRMLHPRVCRVSSRFPRNGENLSASGASRNIRRSRR